MIKKAIAIRLMPVVIKKAPKLIKAKIPKLINSNPTISKIVCVYCLKTELIARVKVVIGFVVFTPD